MAASPTETQTDFRIEWVSASVPPTLKPSADVYVPASFRNSSPRVLGNDNLAISYHWMDAADPQKVIEWDGARTVVLHPLKPREAYDAEVKVRAPKQAGEYILNLDLVREGVAWFSQKGSTSSAHRVSVKP